MPPSFVDIVGFQLEKVHSGVLAWLLHSARSPLEPQGRVELLGRLCGIALKVDEVREVRTTREYSFGRGKRIDLVAEIDLTDGAKMAVVMELKTDSPVYIKQLRTTRQEWEDKHGASVRTTYLVLALGASEPTLAQHNTTIGTLGYRPLNIAATLAAVSGLQIAGAERAYYNDWISSLLAEQHRLDSIDEALLGVSGPYDEALAQIGYRIGFPVFYAYYGKLREVLNRSNHRDWLIASGQNNPVMTWPGGELHGARSIIYLEFNGEAFCLKVEPKGVRDGEWEEYLEELRQVAAVASGNGRPTANRSGRYRTVYKWPFRLSKQKLADVAERTSFILDAVCPRLPKVVR